MDEVKTRVLIACNTLTQIHGEAYQNHSVFFYRLGKDHPEIEFHNLFARRMSIDRFRNYAAKTAIQLDCQYLVFIDDDMKFPKFTFTKLYEGVKEYGILAALNYIRGYPYKPMSFELAGGHMEVTPDEKIVEAVENGGRILEVAAIGTAVCIIDCSLFKTTPAPWFVTGPHNTEDIYFCLKAREHNPELKVGTHCGIITGHLLEPEVISYNTRRHLLDYDESYMVESQIEMNKNGDRGAGYVQDNVEPLLELLKAKGQSAAA